MIKMKNNKKITKDMKIKEVIEKYPETLKVFDEFNFHCIGCMAASFETIEQGASVHGIDVEEFVEKLNKSIENEK